MTTPDRQRRLTLTFDNGPLPGTTERVLAALEERELPAIFFMVGREVLATGGLDVARRVHDAGHRIGNHTLSHGMPLGEDGDRDRAVAEIEGAQAALAELADPERLFRPNGMGVLGPHLLSTGAVDHLVAGKYTVVTWNCVPGDWEEPSDGWIVRAHTEIGARDWAVLVLHDNLPQAVDHLPRFLDAICESDIEVTSELPRRCVPIQHGEVQGPLAGIVAEA